MSLTMYLAQVTGVTAVLLVLIRNQSWILQAQVSVWALATAVIATRFGVTGQLYFFSNDQFAHVLTVNILRDFVWLRDMDFALKTMRLPYTLPAALLHEVGIEAALACKTVSLLCLLRVTNELVSRDILIGWRETITRALLGGCTLIGTFFSALALRETMMMLLTTSFLRREPVVQRLLTLALLSLLRPHLAVCLAIGALIVEGHKRLCRPNQHSVFGVLAIVVLSSFVGWLLFSLLLSLSIERPLFGGHRWGIQPIIGIASNYFGLQFLTVPPETTSLPLQSLLLLRFMLFETVLIPCTFTLLIITRPHRVNHQTMLVLTSFAIYVGLVTNTDFNSFRQNIPFIPAIGLAIFAMTEQRLRKSKFAVMHS